MNRYEITLTFTEPLLGTVPKSKKLYEDYILGKAEHEGVELTEEEKQAELQTVQEMAEKGWTGFHMVGEQPALRHHVIKGFFKDACSMLRRVEGTKSNGFTAHKKKIDGLVFAKPKHIPLVLPDGAEMDVLERPLRASTAQGERVALAVSDSCPVGTTLTFTLEVLGGVPLNLLREWLDYGERRGLGAWRNAGYGTFTYKLEEIG